MTATHRCLILAPTGEDGALIGEVFTSDGLTVKVCSDVPDLCRELRGGVGAVVVAEEAVTAAHAAEIRGLLDEEPAWSVVPFVMLMSSGEGDDAHRIVDLFGMHAKVTLIERPCRAATLTSAVRVALHARERQYEIRSLLERLESQAKELSRSNDDLTRFASAASHDLQEPLRMISNYLGLIQARSVNLEENLRKYLTHAIAGASRMNGLITSLLEYARIGSAEPELTTFPAAEAVAEALANLRLKIDEVKPAIDIAELSTITADKTLIVQIFQNIIGNAIKYRSETPHIAVSSSQTEREWIFTVGDNGIGIKADNLKRIFETFQRLHVSDYAGYGIGLATCKRIAEMHGGEIWVESTYGVGSRFFFSVARRIERPSVSIDVLAS
ncbi:MAG: GHKL domain-containing protein [Planctomycetes bacterium]|nr:GHKL domain-containing protein [Planctomycetota bacterium]